MKVIAFLAILVLFSLPSGESLRCYTCISFLDPNCYTEPTKVPLISCENIMTELYLIKDKVTDFLVSGPFNIKEEVWNAKVVPAMKKFINQDEIQKKWNATVADVENSFGQNNVEAWGEQLKKIINNIDQDKTQNALKNFAGEIQNYINEEEARGLGNREKIANDKFNRQERKKIWTGEITDDDQIEDEDDNGLRWGKQRTTGSRGNVRNRRESHNELTCIKVVNRMDPAQVSRSCAVRNPKCDNEYECFTCNSDGCNSSSSIKVGIITLFLSVLLVLGLLR